MKIKIQNPLLQENTKTNFNTQDNNERTVAANSTEDNSTNNNNINTRAIGQHHKTINGNSHNEQPETRNSNQRNNLNSFWLDRLDCSSNLNDQQNRVNAMGDKQTFIEPAVQSHQLSTTFPQPVPFYTP